MSMLTHVEHSDRKLVRSFVGRKAARRVFSQNLEREIPEPLYFTCTARAGSVRAL